LKRENAETNKALKAYRLWYVILRALFGLFYRLRVLNAGRIPEGPLLVCANHSSAMDPLFVCFSFGRGRHVRFMAKRELMEAPVLGAFLSSVGVFAVDRGRSDVNAVKTAMRILRDGGIVGIFPEGTRRREDGAGARTGAVMLASRTGASLLPVYIPRRKRLFSRVTVAIGEPFKIEGPGAEKRDYEALASELMEKIAELGKEA
jgi:1-acyl-sn-glycerol-3-phosphate acyltransferase